MSSVQSIPSEIILDTNALGTDFSLSGISLEVFFTGVQELGHRVHIPEAGLEELAAKYRTKIQELNELQGWIVREYKRLGGAIPESAFVLFDEEDEVREFLIKFRSRLEELGVPSLPFPDVEARVLSEKALFQKRPFKDRTTGYRDCLVWYSVLRRFSGTQAPLLLVTASRAGFGHEAPSHIDLQSDLLEYKLDPDQFFICNSVDEANHRFILPRLPQVDNVDYFFGENPHNFDLEEWFLTGILAVAEAQGWTKHVAGMAETNGKVSISGIKEIKELTIDDIRRLGKDRYLLYAHSTALLDVKVEYTAQDFFNDPVLPDLLGPGEAPEGTAFFDIESIIAFSMILDEGQLEVRLAEIDAVEGSGYNYVNLTHPYHRLDNQPEE